MLAVARTGHAAAWPIQAKRRALSADIMVVAIIRSEANMHMPVTKNEPTAGVLQHNQKSAATWSAGGRSYDKISETTADALDHVIQRIDPQPKEYFLDIATGTGWTARRIFDHGAKVIGIAIGEAVIAAAKLLAPHNDFRGPDAEALPFTHRTSYADTSTFRIVCVSQPHAHG